MTPQHGFTRAGHPVHGRTSDYHRTDSRYARLNKRAALLITAHVGTMTCTWLFCVLALCSLPATLVAAKVVPGTTFNVGGLYLASAGLILLVTWAAQSFIQLVLLPAIMVGQQLQNLASDARSSKAFEDTERIVDALDLHTQGGLTEIKNSLDALDAKVSAPRPSRAKPRPKP